jgi:DNA-binding PadR family transcriptional regulator
MASNAIVMTNRRDPTAAVPLTPAVFHVLLTLAEADQHGYAIIKAVSARTDGAVHLSTGTLYGMVKRLLADGIIVESRQRPAADADDERRRYYRLTEFGRQVARAEAERLAQLVAEARAIRLLGGKA